MCRHLEPDSILFCRDLKPDNILLSWEDDDTEHGTPVLVKLADFGESLDCAAEGYEGFQMLFVRCGGEPSRGGAQAYLPPEVMNATAGTQRSQSFIDYSKSDVFSLGMVAHFLLSGRSAFDVQSSCDCSLGNYVELVASPSWIQELVRWRNTVRVLPHLNGMALTHCACRCGAWSTRCIKNGFRHNKHTIK